ncbi:MAG TPA: flagellar motor protein MotA [Stellaceae bacterium]|nr:flagellar motor protein MotA [Stellaceae bacterium]
MVTRPRRYLFRMVIFVLAVAAGAALLGRPLEQYFLGNPAVNGIILGILLAGIVYIFHQVIRLNPEVTWIEKFRISPDAPNAPAPPRLLSPMATMLADRRGGKVSLSPTALRTLLDGIGSRLEETRETSRYLIGLLVFLGLLGTFYGLLETVQSVKGVIGGLAVGPSDVARAFQDLQARLETPLSGMSTAFSASLFGLAGSLILGFLDLQAGLALNRFYNDLEEWLSGWTRLSAGGFGGEGGDMAAPAFVQALLEQTADGLERLQRILGRGEESRITANNNIITLTERLAFLSDQIRAEQGLLVKFGEQQGELRPVLQRLADSSAGTAFDEEARGHLRNIEVHLVRLTEELAQGRGDAVQEIRSEIRLLARTMAALAKEPAAD